MILISEVYGGHVKLSPASPRDPSDNFLKRLCKQPPEDMSRAFVCAFPVQDTEVVLNRALHCLKSHETPPTSFTGGFAKQANLGLPRRARIRPSRTHSSPLSLNSVQLSDRPYKNNTSDALGGEGEGKDINRQEDRTK